jgi:phage gp29-like protein
MKIFRNKDIKSLISKARLDVFKNISKNTPENGNAVDKLIREQLDRITTNISNWRSSVDAAEDIHNPDRQELMEQYRDFVDDYQLWAVMQSRINKSTGGSFRIMGEDGEIDEEEEKKFLDPQGHPLQWFRNFMIYVVEAKFYGWEAIQLGDVVNDTFASVEKIPEENQIPYWDSMIKDVNMTFVPGGDNVIDFTEDGYDDWVIRTGSKTNLGLINKCAPYIIYKKVFGNWSQHASIFGMPLRVGTTNLADNQRRQNMINAFLEAEGASWMIKDELDGVEFIANAGTDPHQIYGMLIEKCDAAISKIVLSQTGTTDEKAYSGSAGVHAGTEADVIYSDKLDIKAVVNDLLIPRMKKIGMISESKKIFGGWDHSEKLTIQDWSKVIQELSGSGFSVDPEEVEKHTTIKVDPTVVAMPENKTFSIMNKIDRLYGKNNS